MTNESNRQSDSESRTDKPVESKSVIDNVDGGDPGVSRDSVEEARRHAREQAPGLPSRPSDVDPGEHGAPLRGDPPRTATENVQNLSGGAKEAFETAADDRDGRAEINRGFRAEGRPEGFTGEDGDPAIDDLPADGRMNQEARGLPNQPESGTAAETSSGTDTPVRNKDEAA